MRTALSDLLGIEHPIICAPMWPAANGALARAVSDAGAFGMIGIGSADPVERVAKEAAAAREGSADRAFGLGMMAWAIDKRPELLEAAIAAAPAMISISFGEVGAYVKRVKAAGIKAAVQVQDRDKALAAEAAGADLIVAQGTDAGGHTGAVGTMPIMQIVLDLVKTPVAVAGGIATGRGLAAVLAAGACGAWIGTPFLLAAEAGTTAEARARIAASTERNTILTDVFDVAARNAWPKEFKGRALVNEFVQKWEGHSEELARDEQALKEYAAARERTNYDTMVIYAGQTVGLLSQTRPAAEIVRDLASGARECLAAAAALVKA